MKLRFFGGTVRIFGGEMLVVPSGLLTVAFLTRVLSLPEYGLYTLSIALVSWIEVSVTSLFTRATLKFVGEAEDWRAAAMPLLWLYGLVSVAAALALWLLVQPLTAWLQEPRLGPLLGPLALDIPLYCLGVGFQHVLIGRGLYTPRAYAGASRWISRPLLIAVFVQWGWGVSGAVAGHIGATFIEMSVSAIGARPALFFRSSLSWLKVWPYTVPLWLSSLSLRAYDNVDLLLLQALGGSVAQVGLYSAAENLAIVPGVFNLAFTPLVLAAMSRAMREPDPAHAQTLARDALRVMLALLPFALMTVAVAPEAVVLVYGPTYLASAPLLALLIFSELGLTTLNVATAIIVAAKRPGLVMALTVALLPLAVAGHLFAIPRLGAIGAALVTGGFAWCGVVVAFGLVYRLLHVAPPALALLRILLVSLLAYALAVAWPTPGALLVVKIALVSLAILLGYLLTGELAASDLLGWFARPPESQSERAA